MRATVASGPMTTRRAMSGGKGVRDGTIEICPKMMTGRHHLLGDQLVMRGNVAAGDGVARALDPELADRSGDAGALHGVVERAAHHRHGALGGAHEQDALAERHGLLHHRLLGTQHRHAHADARLVDGGAEGRRSGIRGVGQSGELAIGGTPARGLVLGRSRTLTSR